MNRLVPISLTQLTTVTLALLVICASANARQCHVREPGTYVVYINGMLTELTTAEAGMNLLQASVEPHMAGTGKDAKLEFDMMYNPTNGPLLDLMEAFEQRMGAIGKLVDWTQFWRMVNGIVPGSSEYKAAHSQVFQKHYKSMKANQEEAVQNVVQKCTAALLEGSKVLLVGHSQGNLFINQVYDRLRVEKTLKKRLNSIGVVAIATPASRVAGGGMYTTLYEDKVINMVRSIFPGTKAGNVRNANPSSPTSHFLADDYLKIDTQSRKKILSQIRSTIVNLRRPTQIARRGIITVTLRWGRHPDVDLHVREPTKRHVYYKARYGKAGHLDRDDTNGYGPEHYYVSCKKLKTGRYKVGVNYYAGKGTATARIQIQAGLRVRSFKRSLRRARGSSGNGRPKRVAIIDVRYDAHKDIYLFDIE